MRKPKRAPSEIVVRVRGHAIVLSRPKGRVELRRDLADGSSALMAAHPLQSVEEVQLFLGPNGHRMVLRIEGDTALDLGDGVTSLESLAQGRQIARLLERNLEIRVMDYRDAYFADASPILYAYLSGDAQGPENETLVDWPLRSRLPPAPGDEDPTLENAPAVGG